VCPAQELLLRHKDDVRKVAERLLEVETINQHDLTELVGARPFASDVSGMWSLLRCSLR
jgi:AFG3 family protein